MSLIFLLDNIVTALLSHFEIAAVVLMVLGLLKIIID